jgi:hypothetical protein
MKTLRSLAFFFLAVVVVASIPDAGAGFRGMGGYKPFFSPPPRPVYTPRPTVVRPPVVRVQPPRVNVPSIRRPSATATRAPLTRLPGARPYGSSSRDISKLMHPRSGLRSAPTKSFRGGVTGRSAKAAGNVVRKQQRGGVRFLGNRGVPNRPGVRQSSNGYAKSFVSRGVRTFAVKPSAGNSGVRRVSVGSSSGGPPGPGANDNRKPPRSGDIGKGTGSRAGAGASARKFYAFGLGEKILIGRYYSGKTGAKGNRNWGIRGVVGTAPKRALLAQKEVASGTAKLVARVEATKQRVANDSGARPRIDYRDVGPLRKPNPAIKLLPEHTILLSNSAHIQSRKSSRFKDLKYGSYPDAKAKYLWTIDARGVNVALERSGNYKMTAGEIKHTNISSKASIGGEAWFKNERTVVINSGSGRFGDGLGITRKQWDAAAGYWKQLGYNVEPRPFNTR